ncbi:hypothetical protein LUZ60_007143 [Juncus effusus]|nr:hypothetical protein LUZ60_007143 [Juncus effusus]
MQRIYCLCVLLILVVFLLLSGEVSAKTHGNPAKEIMTIINKNRTLLKLPELHDNPGLGCMALQFIAQCTSNCSKNNTLMCGLNETDITEIYAANCGVELPTMDTVTGHLIACSWNYLSPDEAFGRIVEKNGSGVLRSKGSLEAGAAFREAGRKGPYFWCVLFSGTRGNESFVLEGGKGIEQKEGCFSGADLTCSLGFSEVLLEIRSVLVWMFLSLCVLFLG